MTHPLYPNDRSKDSLLATTTLSVNGRGNTANRTVAVSFQAKTVAANSMQMGIIKMIRVSDGEQIGYANQRYTP